MAFSVVEHLAQVSNKPKVKRNSNFDKVFRKDDILTMDTSCIPGIGLTKAIKTITFVVQSRIINYLSYSYDI